MSLRIIKDSAHYPLLKRVLINRAVKSLTSLRFYKGKFMAKSSINFQKSKGHSYDHNFRKDEPNYLLKAENRLENFYWQNERTAREIFDDELKEYGAKKGKRPRFENSHWEAVLNLNKNHTLEDVQKVARYIEQKFNITCATIAVHRDEGHYKNDKPQYNFHAHITFVTVKDGQQNWRKEKIKPADLRELQTAVAEILQMERGQENSKAERLSHRQYKQVAQEKEQLEDKILTLKERNAILEQARKDNTGLDRAKAFFANIFKIKKSKQQYTEKQLLAEIERLKELDDQSREENERLQRQQEQQAQLAAKAAELERQNKELNLKLSHEQWRNDMLKNVNDELEAENNKLKSLIKEVFNYIRIASKSLFDTMSNNIFSNELTALLLNKPKKDEEFIDRSKETQQRSNLTPLQPENHQEQKQEEQQSDEAKDKPQEQKTRKNRRQ